MLSAAEVARFRAFGFHVVRGALDPSEFAEIQRAFAETRPCADPFESFGRAGTLLGLHADDQYPAFGRLACHPRIFEALHDLAGTPCLYLGCFILENRDDTPWHTTGTPGDEVATIRVTVYLDEMTAEQGALHVIPGTHPTAWSRALFENCGYWQGNGTRLRVRDVPGAHAIASRPGDAVIWYTRLWHSAPKRRDGQPRRGIFLTYEPDPGEDPARVERLRNDVRSALREDRPQLHSPLFLAQDDERSRWTVARLKELQINA